MTLHEQIGQLRKKNVRVYIVATGAGAGIQDELWQVPGASAFLVGASFPYESAQTDAFLGFRPETYASSETALDLAMEAYRRAVRHDVPQRPVGLALTGSVATTREHRGEHRIHVACVTDDSIVAADVTLPKGAGRESRLADGYSADLLGVRVLLTATGIVDMPVPELRDGTTAARQQLFRHPLFEWGHRTEEPPDRRWPLFPGAFNPPHAAHQEIANVANGRYGRCVFAICAQAPHKPPLSVQDMLSRSTHFAPDQSVLFTWDDPLYIDKARRFPGRPLILGADALLRMLDPQWGRGIGPMLDEFSALGTTFLVFGRTMDRLFVSAGDAISRVPSTHRYLFSALPGRWDISSTELRRNTAPAESVPAGGADVLARDVTCESLGLA